MDFHSLPRRELQALCKKHKIPANMTNVAMADALVELYSAGPPAEDSSAAQESKASCVANFRQNTSVSSDDELPVMRSRTGRSSRRGAAKGGKAEKDIDGIPLIELLDTPVVTTGRKTRAREASKTPAVEVAVDVEKKHEEVVASNSRRASMRPRKVVSFAVDEDGEGDRGFGMEVKKTPVAPRIDAEEEMDTARRTTRLSSRQSASARATSGRRSGRLKAVTKMIDLSAAEERSEEDVAISKKPENVLAEKDTSVSVVTYEADGEEEIPSRARRGSVEISEDLTSVVDIAGDVAGVEGGHSGEVKGEVEEPESLQPAVSETNLDGTPALVNVREVSHENLEKAEAEDTDDVAEARCDIAGDGVVTATVPEIPNANHVYEVNASEVLATSEAADSGDAHCTVVNGELEVGEGQEDLLEAFAAQPLVAEVDACYNGAEDGEIPTEIGEELEKIPQIPDAEGVAGGNNMAMETDTDAQSITGSINANDNGVLTKVFEQEQGGKLDVQEAIPSTIADVGDEEDIAAQVAARFDDASEEKRVMEVADVQENLAEPRVEEKDTPIAEVLACAEDSNDQTEIDDVIEDLPQILGFLSIAEINDTVMEPMERKEADIVALVETTGKKSVDYDDLTEVVEEEDDPLEVLEAITVPTADEGDVEELAVGEEKDLMLIGEVHEDGAMAAAGCDGAMVFRDLNGVPAMKVEDYADAVTILEKPVADCSYNSGSYADETARLVEISVENKVDSEIDPIVQTADSGDYIDGVEAVDDTISTAAITMQFEVIAWNVEPISETVCSNESTVENSDKLEQGSDLPDDLEIGNVSVTTNEQKHNLDAPLEVVPSNMENIPAASIVSTATPTATIYNKENAGFAMYGKKVATMENVTEKNTKVKQSDWKEMSLRQLRKELERMSISDKRHDENERKKRPALATLPENCLKSPQSGSRC